MRNRVFSSLLAATSLLAACSPDHSGDGGGDAGGTIIVSMGSDAGTLFPVTVQDETGKAVTELLFDHLAEIGDGMATIGDAGFQPRLAKSWDWARDSMSIAFHIDPAARFHDGVPVRASDVRYSFKLVRDTTVASMIAPLVSNIDSVSTPDSLTATFWFKRHQPEEFYDVAYQISVLPEHVYGKVAAADMKTSEVLRHPVGSGTIPSREMGRGEADRAGRRHRQLSRPRKAGPRRLSARAGAARRRDGRPDRRVGFLRVDADRSGAPPRQQRDRARHSCRSERDTAFSA